MGSRFGGLKQVEPVDENGAFLLDYSIYDAIQAGFDHVVFIIKEEHLEIFRSTIGQRIEQHVRVDYAFQRLTDIPAGVTIPPERTKPWGTAHAVLSAECYINDPFVAINADDYYGAEAFGKMAAFLSAYDPAATPKICAMAGYVLGNTLTENGHVSRGVCEVTPDGFLTRVTERLKLVHCDGGVKDLDDDLVLPGDSYASMNFWGFTPDVFAKLHEQLARFFALHADQLTKAEFFLPFFLTSLMEEGYARVKVLPTAAKWYGVTYPEDKQSVVDFLAGMVADGAYPKRLF